MFLLFAFFLDKKFDSDILPQFRFLVFFRGGPCSVGTSLEGFMIRSNTASFSIIFVSPNEKDGRLGNSVSELQNVD